MSVEVSSFLSSPWMWYTAYFTLSLTLDCCLFVHMHPYRYRATDLLAQYYILTYLIGLCAGVLGQPWYSAELYFAYFVMIGRAVKDLSIGKEVYYLLGWQMFLLGLKLTFYIVGLDITVPMDSPSAFPVSEGVSWVWLGITLGCALIVDWVLLCNRCRDWFPATRSVVLYYCLNYVLSVTGYYITGWWYTAEYYSMFIFLTIGLCYHLDITEYIAAFIWWQVIIGAISILLHLFGVSEISGWTGYLVSTYLLPVTIIVIKYGLCFFACFFISLGIVYLLDHFRRVSGDTPKTSSEISNFAVSFFIIFAMTLGLLVLAWLVMWVVGWVFGSVPWLMQCWYRVTIALIGAVVGDYIRSRTIEDRDLSMASDFVAMFISLYVIGEGAAIVLG